MAKKPCKDKKKPIKKPKKDNRKAYA